MATEILARPPVDGFILVGMPIWRAGRTTSLLPHDVVGSAIAGINRSSTGLIPSALNDPGGHRDVVDLEELGWVPNYLVTSLPSTI